MISMPFLSNPILYVTYSIILNPTAPSFALHLFELSTFLKLRNAPFAWMYLSIWYLVSDLGLSLLSRPPLATATVVFLVTVLHPTAVQKFKVEQLGVKVGPLTRVLLPLSELAV